MKLNYPLPALPQRTEKPRQNGLTMVIDKGLSCNEAQNLVEVAAGFVDFVKLGFGTSLITGNLEKKLAIYRAGGIDTYFGGSLFEIFLMRQQFDGFVEFNQKYGMELVEVSDGVLPIEPEDKLNYISDLSNHFKVISEVGSKLTEDMTPQEWAESIKAEKQAGSIKVICEAREAGNIGIFGKSGQPKDDLINTILEQNPVEDIIWETPQKSQQVWFIKKFGTNVNLGNIAPSMALELEALRLGLRGDTMLDKF